MIPQIEPFIDYGDLLLDIAAYFREVEGGPWLTQHHKTAQLEMKIAEFLGVRYCIMMPSGTMALYAALVACDVGRHSHVIVPDFTMIATPNAVQMTDADVSLVDIDPDTLCLDLVHVRRTNWNTICAAILVSINGRFPSIKETVERLHEHQFIVIEDACQSFGSKVDGQYLGTFGDVGCFSLSPHKIITTGQGGFCVTNDDDIIDRLEAFQNFGRWSSATRHRHNYRSYGINLKFTDLQAVVGLNQMKDIDWRIERKKAIYRQYRILLCMDEVTFIDTDLDQTVPWYVDILVEDQENLIRYLESEGIRTQRFYPAIRDTAPYDDVHLSTDHSRNVSKRGLWLPSSLTLTDSQIDHICSVIWKFYDIRREDQ